MTHDPLTPSAAPPYTGHRCCICGHAFADDELAYSVRVGEGNVVAIDLFEMACGGCSGN